MVNIAITFEVMRSLGSQLNKTKIGRYQIQQREKTTVKKRLACLIFI